MHFDTRAFAAKSLIAPVLLLALAACGDAAAPVDEETSPAEAAITTPVPAASEPVAAPVVEPSEDAPVAGSSAEPASSRAEAPAARDAALAPVAPPTPTTTATPAADPHAGHDMSTMSDEQMNEMGHNQ
ncbi:hypothetical protein ACXYN8_08245 [Altererythrobacter sp. CAU 1778]